MARASAGYSGTPLPKKLGIKTGSVVVVIDAPRDLRTLLGRLPVGAMLHKGLRGKARPDIILLFAARRSELEKRIPSAKARMTPTTSLWIAWPKKASNLDTDLAREQVRDIGLAHALVDIKVCAIDQTWSGLRFVIPVDRRPKA
jgi:hypothetical protein